VHSRRDLLGVHLVSSASPPPPPRAPRQAHHSSAGAGPGDFGAEWAQGRGVCARGKSIEDAPRRHVKRPPCGHSADPPDVQPAHHALRTSSAPARGILVLPLIVRGRAISARSADVDFSSPSTSSSSGCPARDQRGVAVRRRRPLGGRLAAQGGDVLHRPAGADHPDRWLERRAIWSPQRDSKRLFRIMPPR
jgi:hypothetical protein